jgi:ATP-dependent helicase HrpA
VLPTEAEQSGAMVAGTRRLLRRAVASPGKAVERGLNARTRLVLGANPDGSLQALLDDCADAAVDSLVPAPVWTRAEFDALRESVARRLVPTTQAVLSRVEAALRAAHDVEVRLPASPPPAQADAIADIRAQLARLLPPGFVCATGAGHLADLTRYLTAIGRRLERLPHGVGADSERMQRVHAVEDAYEDLVAALSPTRASADDVRDIARMIEELRVSLWAQQLGTARPVSEQRIYRTIEAVQP